MTMMELSGLNRLRQRKTVVRGIVLFALTAGIFFLLFRRINLRLVLSTLKQIPPVCLLLATSLTLSFPVISALRWQIILRSMGHKATFTRCLVIIVGVWPISAISPGKIGDLLKVYSLRQRVDGLTVAGSVIVERALDIIVLASFALFGGIFFRNIYIISVSVAAFLLIFVSFLLIRIDFPFPGKKKIQARITELFNSLQKIGGNSGALILILLLTIANWFASVVQTKVLFDGVGVDVTLGFVLAALPVAIFIGLLPITVAGMGTRDAAMIALFSTFASSHEALVVALLYSFFGYWLMSIIGLPFIRKAMR